MACAPAPVGRVVWAGGVLPPVGEEPLVPLVTTGPGPSDAVGTITAVVVTGTLVSTVSTEELETAEEAAEVVATAVVVASTEELEVAASELELDAAALEEAAGVETEMVTPADSHSAEAAARAFCWSDVLQAPSMHVVELLTKAELEQAHAKSVKLQSVCEMPAVRHVKEQLGKSLKLWAETMATKPATKTATDFILYKEELKDESANECPRALKANAMV